MDNNIYGVVFGDKGKIYNFKADFVCPINVTVIVKTELGEQFGKVVKKINNESVLKNYDNLSSVIRIATKKDYSLYLKNLKDASIALEKANSFAKELNLDMKIISASYTFDRSLLQFNFLADERIDFRELVKKLANSYRTRIELRQIGSRDKAKEVGGIGVCGRKLCCSSFLNNMDSVSINMAKNQNLALNPSKINGLCGRLLCCLAYEDENYSSMRKNMPSLGSKYKTDHGIGEVVYVDVLRNTIRVKVNESMCEVIFNNENEK